MRDEASEPRSSIGAIYADKPPSYFANARHDIVARLESGPEASVLELGCGSGGTARAVMAAHKAGRYVGIELSPSAAAAAADALDEVLVGDVETMDLSALSGRFDILIISEVLEHLTDPWTTLSRLATCLKPGGRVYSSSPNIAHWGVIRSLLGGRFDYAEKGVMDRTHLRWFTPRTYAELFRSAGFEVESVGPVTPLRPMPQLVDSLTGGRLRYLFYTQIMVVGRRPASGP
jgi:2-polyprenyl-3-methyl-5-hydroxy-6-metoxy-1,4-benzoquinol methylase